MSRDNGWINTLLAVRRELRRAPNSLPKPLLTLFDPLQEAENERLHLLTFLKIKEASWPLRVMVILTQGESRVSPPRRSSAQPTDIFTR